MLRTRVHRIGRTCFYWLTLLFWMALIYWLSDQPVLPHPGRKVGISDHFGDYAAHAFMFGVLTFLAWRVLRTRGGWPAFLSSRLSCSAGVFAALYAVSDEVHQYFVPGRWAKVADWVADLVGIVVVVGLLSWWQHCQVRCKGWWTAVRRAWE